MILIMPDNINQIKDNLNLYDGIILSLDKYSVNTIYNLSIDEIKDLLPLLKEKEVFISMNKNIENKYIDDLHCILLELNNYNIKGVLYSDLSFLTFKDELNYDLVWAQEHLTTNYETINYYRNFGVLYTYLSSDITKNEIVTIKNHTKNKLMMNMFGYLPIFVSKRHIISNYLNYFHLKDESHINYIEKEDKIYPIIENDYTCVFSNNILNGLKEFYNLELDYYVFNGMLIENDKFSEVLKIINNMNKENVLESYLKINDMFDNVDTSFLYKETISKVKK